MNNKFFPNFRTTLLIIIILLGSGPSFCQENKDLPKAQKENSKRISPEQTILITKILSGYNPSKLTAPDAKVIQEKFRDGGIHAGPECESVIRAAGFDPEKLRQLAPPPESERTGKRGTQPPLEERLKVVVEKICKPLILSEAQQETFVKAFSEFYTEMDKLRKSEPTRQTPLDKSKIDPLEKARDLQIKKVITSGQFAKYLELEKAARPGRSDANGSKTK